MLSAAIGIIIKVKAGLGTGLGVIIFMFDHETRGRRISPCCGPERPDSIPSACCNRPAW